MSRKLSSRRNRGFLLNIRTRHPSHNQIRGKQRLPFPTFIRLGSTTPTPTDRVRVECNTVTAVQTSADKLLMKEAFAEKGVPTASWLSGAGLTVSSGTAEGVGNLKYPVVLKSRTGSRNRGNYIIKSESEWRAITAGKNFSRYIVEEYVNFIREYRLHVTQLTGCFYTCRKMLKSDTPEENRWYRNDSNCVWYVEDNPKFDKPANWLEIEKACVLALEAVGLDIGACDVRVNKDGTKFSIIEINSAPAFGEGTAEKYLSVLPALLTYKHDNQ